MKTLSADIAVGDLLHSLFEQLSAAMTRAAKGGVTGATLNFVAPPSPAVGDLAFRCFELAKEWGMSPNDVAKELAASLKPEGIIVKCQAAGPYLNIFLDRSAIASRLLAVVEQEGDQYGHSTAGSTERVMVEYVSPNTNKPLHLGHIRNGVIGWSVAELYKAIGCAVFKTDIINDRGVHIAKSMLAYQRWAEGATPESAGEKGDHFVGRFYVRFEQELQKERADWLARHPEIDVSALDDRQKGEVEERFLKESPLMLDARELLRAWEQEDPEIRALWKQMNGWVYAGFDETYKNLGIDFDKHYYESDIFQGGRELIFDAAEKGIFRREANGAIAAPLSEHLVRLPGKGKEVRLPNKVVLRADGTGLYITQDLNLATIKFRDFNLTHSIYVIGSEQDLYMQQLFLALKLLGFPWADGLYHLSYGMVYLPEGKMKSREGRVVDADDLMKEIIALAREVLKERYPGLPEEEIERRSRAIGLAALKFHFLIVGKDSPIYFDPKESLSFEGKTGPYLQYSFARATSILRKAGDIPPLSGPVPISEDLEWQLVLGILDFPRVILDAARSYDPSRLGVYLVELAQLFSTFYHSVPVLTAEPVLRGARLKLVSSFRTVVKNGLALMGIDTLEEM